MCAQSVYIQYVLTEGEKKLQRSVGATRFKKRNGTKKKKKTHQLCNPHDTLMWILSAHHSVILNNLMTRNHKYCTGQTGGSVGFGSY